MFLWRGLSGDKCVKVEHTFKTSFLIKLSVS